MTMHYTDITQQYRTVAEIRGALAEERCKERCKLLPDANARAFRLRLSLGLSQSAMAERCGVSRSMVQKVELGQKRVPEAVLRVLDEHAGH